VQKGFDIACEDGCEYIVRIGSDDVISTNLLKEEAEFLDSNPDYVAICCDLQKFGLSETRINRPVHWVKKHYTNYEILRSYHGYGYAGGMMFRASALNKAQINPEYQICEDFDFHLQLLDLGKIHSIHRALYLYRSHEQNLCKSFSRVSKNEILMKIIRAHNLDKCMT
jgi:GT2 family glycosyltransferase